MFKAEDGRRRTEDGGRVDVAIDRTVREMLDVEPPAGLRGRVLQRISDSDRQGASGFGKRLLWTAVPLGAAALLILATMVARQTPPAALSTSVRDESPRVEVGRPPVTPGAATEPRRAPTVNTDAPRGGARRAPRAAPADARERLVVASVVAAEGTIAIEPLEDVAPIQVGAIGPGTIAHREVIVPPLRQVAQLQISPLSTPDGRF